MRGQPQLVHSRLVDDRRFGARVEHEPDRLPAVDLALNHDVVIFEVERDAEGGAPLVEPVVLRAAGRTPHRARARAFTRDELPQYAPPVVAVDPLLEATRDPVRAGIRSEGDHTGFSEPLLAPDGLDPSPDDCSELDRGR